MIQIRSITSKTTILLLYVVSGIILIPDGFKAYPIILLLLSSVLLFMSCKDKDKLKTPTLIVSASIFLLLVLSISYSENSYYALKKIETASSLVTFPFIFYLIDAASIKKIISSRMIAQIKLVFIYSLLIFLIVTFTYFYLTEPFFTIKSTLIHYTNLVRIRLEAYQIHPIYLSIYIGVAIIFIVSILGQAKGRFRAFLYGILLILIVFTAMLDKKGPIISLGILGLIFILKNKSQTKKVLLISIIALSFLLVVMPKYQNINRYKELINLDNPNSSTSVRLGIYECAFDQFLKSPLIGYGWGDSKDALIECYQHSHPEFVGKKYNSHNQYLSVLLSIGIIGLMIFIMYFIYHFRVSFKHKNQVLLLLLIYFMLNMLTENILEREDGVILYAFFLNLFLFNNSVRDKEESKGNLIFEKNIS